MKNTVTETLVKKFAADVPKYVPRARFGGEERPDPVDRTTS